MRDVGNKLIGVEVRRCYGHQGAKTHSLLYLSLHVIITGGSIKTTFIDKIQTRYYSQNMLGQRDLFYDLPALFS